MKMIAGLGNPGAEYAGTRHNIGFAVLDRLADVLDLRLEKEKYGALFASTQMGGEKVLLIKPLTFMNLSGRSVRRFAEFWKVEAHDLLVIHDDIDFGLGDMRLAFQAGAAGHRGIKSIIEELATKDFYRLRLGIGRPLKGDPVDFVLSRFQKEELDQVESLIEKTVAASRTWVKAGAEGVKQLENEDSLERET